MLKLFCNIARVTRPFYQFNTGKKTYLFELSRQLLNNSNDYKAWKNIRIIHNIMMARYDPELANIE